LSDNDSQNQIINDHSERDKRGRNFLRNINTFRSLKNPVYRLYFTGIMGQRASMNMQMIARSYLIYEITGSAAILGVLSICNALPILFFSVFGGVIADRIHKKYVLTIGLAGSAIISLAVALLLSTGYISSEREGSWWVLALSAVLQGCIMGLMIPSRQAIIPEIVDEEEIMNAVSLDSTGMNILRLVSPALAGFLVDLFGYGSVYYVMTGMYVFGTVCIIFMPLTGKLVSSTSNVLQDIKEGLFTGYPIGSSYGYVADGLFVDQDDVDSWPDQSRFGAEPGLIRFKDLSGPEGVPDGIVDAEYDRRVIGQPMPITIYALSISAEYKGFYLAAMFQGEGGRTASMLASSSETKDDISLSYWMEHDNQGNVQQFIWDTRWTLENPDPNAGWPKLQLGGDRLPNRTTSTYWQRETTFVRLKNLQLGYNLPERIVSKIRMDGARFYVNGENLLTFTKFYPGWDPEIWSRDEGWYPLTKTWLVGISIDF